MEKREHFYTVGRNVNWCSQYGKQHGHSFKKLKSELPYNTANPLLDIFPKKIKILTEKGTGIPMFIAALFTRAKIWKQSKCPLIDE